MNFTGKNISFSNGKSIQLSSLIIKAIEFRNVLLILIEPMHDNHRNVYCYDIEGNFLWQIPEPVKLHAQNFYTGIYIDDETMCAYAISGVEYRLSETGTIISSELIK